MLTSNGCSKVARDADGTGGGQHFTVPRLVLVDALERCHQFGHESGNDAGNVHQRTLNNEHQDETRRLITNERDPSLSHIYGFAAATLLPLLLLFLMMIGDDEEWISAR